MPANLKPASLVRRLSLWLSLVIGAVSLVVTLFAAGFLAIKENRAQEALADRTCSDLTESLEKPLWDFDNASINEIATAFSRNDRICRLSVTGSDGENLFSYSRQGVAEGINRAGKIIHKGEPIGSVLLAFSHPSHWDSLRNFIYFTLVTDFFVLIALGFGTGIIIRRQLRIPLNWLKRITDAHSDLALLQSTGKAPFVEFEPFLDVLKKLAGKIKLQMDDLRASEKRFRSAFDSAAIGMALVGLDGRWLRVNQSLCRIVGYSEEELLARDFQSITYPDDLGADLDLMCQLIGGSVPHYYMEKRYLHKQGRIVWVFISVSLLRDTKGNPLYFISQIQDITERKRMAEKLRESEETFAKAFHSTPAITILTDLGKGGRLVLVNDAFERITGYQRDEVIGRNTVEIGLWVDVSERSKALHRLQTVGELRSFEMQFRRKNGAIGTGLLSAESIELRGSPCAIVTVMDITDRVRAALDLSLSEERFTKAFQASPEPISIYHHLNGTILEVNESWTATYGYTREEAVDRTALQLNLVTPEARGKLRRLLEENGTVHAYDIDIRNKRGEIRNISLSAESIMIRGEPCNILFHHDVTESRKAEKQLRAISEQLRALAASITTAREEEGTRIAREIHDELGSAFTSLRWDLEDIDSILSESKEGLRLQEVRDKIAAMMRLTDTTVGVVRRVSSELRPAILDDLGLREAIEWHAQQFQAQKGIVCGFSCSVESLSLSQEQSTAVFRIFQEAMTNVLRHAQATRVDIAMEEQDRVFILTVADNGNGITEDQKSGIYSLGILGMHERVHLVGGEIDITGIQGKGTVIKIRIPEQA